MGTVFSRYLNFETTEQTITCLLAHAESGAGVNVAQSADPFHADVTSRPIMTLHGSVLCPRVIAADFSVSQTVNMLFRYAGLFVLI